MTRCGANCSASPCRLWCPGETNRLTDAILLIVTPDSYHSFAGPESIKNGESKESGIEDVA